MKVRNQLAVTLLAVAVVFSSQSCKLLFKSEFTKIDAADLSAYADFFPDMQKRMLAQNEATRKQVITQMKQAFSLAQAAEDEGLHKTDKFKQQMALSTDQLVAIEYGKRNPDANVTKEEIEAYYNAHKAEFEKDFTAVSQNRKTPIPEDQKQQQSLMWSELKLRAERGRKAGLENDPAIKAQLKFGKANLLATLYAESLEQKFKLTDAEKRAYLAEHPEADDAKLKERAQSLLDRVKKGEPFEKVADEANEDGTKGQGGDLNWFTKGKMDPDFENAAFALQKGQMSDQLVKSSFGYHVIRVDDRRMATPTPQPGVTPAPNASPTPPPTPQEEIRARHIYVSTQEADGFEAKLAQEKIKRAMEDASLKYPVTAPDDFQVKVAGFDPNRRPSLGGGSGGTMRGIDPNENK